LIFACLGLRPLRTSWLMVGTERSSPLSMSVG
jgi:hypothetical protein